MISKELLESVLDKEIASINIEENILNYIEDKVGYFEINIYELAHKCKEWAFDNGYYLTIYNDAVDIILQTNCKLIENITDDSFKYSPMLVFKACQWILNNKES